MRADTPSASAARRIAYAYRDLIGTVGNPPAVTVDLLEQRIVRIAPIVLPESQLGIAPPVRVAASAEDPCAFELHSADAHAAPNAALLRFHGTAANGFFMRHDMASRRRVCVLRHGRLHRRAAQRHPRGCAVHTALLRGARLGVTPWHIAPGAQPAGRNELSVTL